MATHSILWRRIDVAGRESARLVRLDDGWLLRGAAMFAWEDMHTALDYEIRCDAGWRTRRCQVAGRVGAVPIDVSLDADAASRWTLNGAPCPGVDGAVDIDLNFSPSTNLLPIRRLALAPGGSASVTAAWLRFPSFALEPLVQTYSRLDERTYRYESAGGRFVRDLIVDADGFVTSYPGFWEAVPASSHPEI